MIYINRYEDCDTDHDRPLQHHDNREGGVTYVKGMTSVKHHPKGGVVYIESTNEESSTEDLRGVRLRGDDEGADGMRHESH